ncbi:hypothetical protein [Comamonas jiangduensis]|uniref:hypothetical protein n=1 Tax=Comamonas jiangduensis TaxID=1194168 RepID=UPI0028A7D2A0|nr:hypothetical protein [Comamonas jiangduensis]
MTLIFAGFETRVEKFNFSKEIIGEFGGDINKISEDVVKVDGVYFAADSAITNNNKTLLNGFRKIYPVKVSLWKPYIAGDTFRGYPMESYSFDVAIAFAGSTLSAQHYMNIISSHLNNLRITLSKGYRKHEFRVIKQCEENPLIGRIIQFLEDPFCDIDCREFLSAEYISSVVLHSLQAGVASASQYKIDEAGFNSLKIEMLLAVQCQKTSKYHLYEYDMNQINIDGLLKIEVSQVEVDIDKVAVIGLKNKYEELANQEQLKIKNPSCKRSVVMFNYLNSCINEENKDENKGIARPSNLKIYRNGKLDFIESKK